MQDVGLICLSLWHSLSGLDQQETESQRTALQLVTLRNPSHTLEERSRCRSAWQRLMLARRAVASAMATAARLHRMKFSRCNCTRWAQQQRGRKACPAKAEILPRSSRSWLSRQPCAESSTHSQEFSVALGVSCQGVGKESWDRPTLELGS